MKHCHKARLNKLLSKGGRAILLLAAGVAGEKQLDDLQQVRLALRSEVSTLPVSIQQKYHTSIVNVDTFLDKAIHTLATKLGLAEEKQAKSQPIQHTHGSNSGYSASLAGLSCLQLAPCLC